MNKVLLKEYLEKLKFDPRTYSLEGGLPTEKYVLEERYGEWCVYYSEKSIRSNERRFDNEEAACDYLLAVLKNDHTTH